MWPSLRASGVPHIDEKLLTKATTFLETSPQLEVCTQSYGPPKSRESQFWEFRDFHLGVHLGIPEQNDIWVLAPWPGTKYTIRGKVMASPKSEPWWILWVHVCSWLIRAPKVFQLRTNQLDVWFVQVWVGNWLVCQSS
jgi:hypothetical protein